MSGFQRKFGQNSTNSTSNNWYEQFQFKAHYHHYRTNNYVAFIQTQKKHALDISPPLSNEKGQKTDSYLRVPSEESRPSKRILIEEKRVRPRSSSSEVPSSSGKSASIHHPGSFLIAHSQSATDVQIHYKPFKYQYNPGPVYKSTLSTSTSSESNCFLESKQFEHHLSNKPIPRDSIPSITLSTPPMDNISKKSEEDPRKLVIASVSYLQRARSPSPLIHSASPSPITTPQDENPIQKTSFFSSCCSKQASIPVVTSEHRSSRSTSRHSAMNPPGSSISNTAGSGSNSKNLIGILKTRTGPNTPSSTGATSESNSKMSLNFSTSAHKSRRSNSSGSVTFRNLAVISPCSPPLAGLPSPMADLQSPHYVKRTAQLFQSKFVTNNNIHNGSSSGRSSASTVCSPSYLNISRSVSGYANSNCHANGQQHVSRVPYRSNQGGIQPPIRHRSLQSENIPELTHHHITSRKYSDDRILHSAPLSSPGLVGRSSSTDRASLILEKIQRLYGDTSQASLWKRRTPPPSSTSANERLIPIKVEKPKAEIIHAIQIVPSQENLNGKHECIDLKKSDQLILDKSKQYYIGIDLPDSSKLDDILTKNSSFKSDAALVISQQSETFPSESSPHAALKSDEVLDLSATSSGISSISKGTNGSVKDSIEVNPSNSSTMKFTKENFPVKDGNYFLNEMNKARSKIEGLIETAKEELKCYPEGSEEEGRLHASIGKGRLLINKKFKQFEGLCHKNLEQASLSEGITDEPLTKNEDLEGFWDMVLIQVEQIYEMFGEKPAQSAKISKDTTDARKVPLKKSVALNKSSTKTPKTVANTARDENRRKLLAEKRQAMMKAREESEAASSNQEIQFFTTDQTK